ncbi:uncharacterized protein LOC118806323 [Colossoma macropomum]|uniref:uncharacterized protein LOC118806323 n=1 Tax=Colossoma macropomum TaxID=42526 RepID=UPI001864F33D|nr:uncharacterized protein LOC118806323 [Colossoma macropomum]
MATSKPRQTLIWDIHKRLPTLNLRQLRTLAAALESEQTEEALNVSTLSEPELYYYITDYVKSEKLQSLEDEGMSCLLLLCDMISELIASNDATQVASESTLTSQGKGTTAQLNATPVQGDNTSPDMPVATQGTCTSAALISMSANMDRDTVMHVSAGRDSVPVGRRSTSSVGSDQVVRLTEVAAFLPRRELKIQGGQISDSGSEIIYNSICKQIDEGLKEGFTESEVIRSVLRVTKPGTFKEFLTDKVDLTVDGLKRLLRSHIRDKSSTELFQELSNAKQNERETPQQFVYRIMGLKQRVLLASQQCSSEFNYDRRLVQGVFLHTLYQGLNEKSNNIRCDIKPYLTDPQVTDDFILEQITKSATEEAERQKRLTSAGKQRPVTVSSAQEVNTDQINQTKLTQVDSELQANRTAIMQLTAQVSALTKSLEKVVTSNGSEMPATHPQSAPKIQPPKVTVKRKCQECIQQGREKCVHCFLCGQAGHRAVGCFKQSGSGNWVRSLERDSQ